MNFTETTLSTLRSIAAWEKEINRLAGKTEIMMLMGSITPITLTFSGTGSADITQAQLTKATGDLAIVDVVDLKITLPQYPIQKIVALDSYDAVLAEFTISEGSGPRIYSDGAISALISNPAAWQLAASDLTWADKLDLAKAIIRQDIVSALLKRYAEVANDDAAIAMLVNPAVFAIASDMKALELIFTDLANSGFNQLYEGKAESYRHRYYNEFAKAMTAMRLAGHEADTEGVRESWEGRIIR